MPTTMTETVERITPGRAARLAILCNKPGTVVRHELSFLDFLRAQMMYAQDWTR